MDQSDKKTPYPSEAMSEADKARWDRADALRMDKRLPLDGKLEAVRVMQMIAVKYRNRPTQAKQQLPPKIEKPQSAIQETLIRWGLIFTGSTTWDDIEILTDEWSEAERTVLNHRKEPLPPFMAALFTVAVGLTFLGIFIDRPGSFGEVVGAVLLLAIAGTAYGVSKRVDFDQAVKSEYDRMTVKKNQL